MNPEIKLRPNEVPQDRSTWSPVDLGKAVAGAVTLFPNESPYRGLSYVDPAKLQGHKMGTVVNWLKDSPHNLNLAMANIPVNPKNCDGIYQQAGDENMLVVGSVGMVAPLVQSGQLENFWTKTIPK